MPQDIVKCGPNALLMFLVLSGVTNVPAAELAALPMGPEGASLLTLQKAAKRFGVETQVRRYESNDVGSVPLPAIVQFRNSINSLSQHHFNVIYKVDSKYLYLLDGTTGQQIKGLRVNMTNHWTGYALMEQRSSKFPSIRAWPLEAIAVSVGLSNVAMLTIFVIRRRRRERKFQVTGVIK